MTMMGKRRDRGGPTPPPKRLLLLSLSFIPLRASLLTSFATALSKRINPTAAATAFSTTLSAASKDDGGDVVDKRSSSQEETRRVALQKLILTATAPLSFASVPSAAAAAATADVSAGALPAVPPQLRSTTWPLGKVAFSLLPLAGTYTRRATVKETLVGDSGGSGVWTFDQVQGVVNVNVPVRMVVIKLSPAAGGGLWIHNPLAPTPQLLSYIRELEKLHGPVRHIVLGTVALEHKATLGPFSQYFPKATVWIQPGQWSFPIHLPIEYLGVVQNDDKLRILPSSEYLHGKITLDEELNSIRERRYSYWAKKSPIPEWTIDIDYETLGPLKFQSVGAYSETAFFHKATKSLIVTDCVCSVTRDPPKVIQEDPRALLYHARDSIEEVVMDDVHTRQKGWRRMVQFGLVFFPSQIEVVPFGQAIWESTKVDQSVKRLGEGAIPTGKLYPWTWHDGDVDVANFDAISQNGKLFCPPILTKLILDREPARTLEWVDRILRRFNFTHVIPGHLNNYVRVDKREFEKAFDPLRSNPKEGKLYPQRVLAEDLALLQEASDLLTEFSVVAQSQVCDLEPARKVGRFAAIAPK